MIDIIAKARQRQIAAAAIASDAATALVRRGEARRVMGATNPLLVLCDRIVHQSFEDESLAMRESFTLRGQDWGSGGMKDVQSKASAG
ncbi:hypothetical protein [Nitrobacter sp.]|uniref:hypothetical protein n=1 Tax=Nitrobacter sp. TaxID=29420 RepID=UPI003F64A574